MLPVDDAGPGVGLEPHGAPEVGRPEEGEGGEGSDRLEETVDEEEEEGGVEMLHQGLICLVVPDITS